jgi:primosomal protein N' (replication factor Y) (superfamily II helicase)
MTEKFASVLIPRPELSQLSYTIPENLDIKTGDCVEIELRKTNIWGIVSGISDSPPPEMEGKSLKPVLGKILSSPVFADRTETSLLKWIAEYYLYPFPKIIKQIFSPLIGTGNTLNGSSDINKHLASLCRCSSPEKRELNIHQKRVVDSILKKWGGKDYKPTLVFGITGSGKSEIFAELCKDTIKKGKQVLYLVPEIGLTSKALEHLINRIGSPGVIIHSFMSKKKRFSSIYCAMSGEAKIIVGTRSSVLYPFFDIGLIIIDEEHDSSYKNLEPPYYNARDFAVMKGAKLKIPVVMGSATPSSDSWHNSLTGKYHLEIIKERANSKPLPEIKMFPYIGDLYLPGDIISKVKESILSGDQSLFFLNRRGFATLALCSQCRKTVKCPGCNTALIYHKKKNSLLCHHCNFTRNEFKCPECGSALKFEGMGIEKLVEAVSEYFPGAEIISFDRDNLTTLSLFDKAVETISKNKGNIIVGTVMISKGHNFPKLKNVIIKYADYILSFQDSRAAEKCFQLIAQVAGRAGRFDTTGAVYAEAVYPDHYLWKYIKDNDYEGFITEELDWRKKLSLPPYTRMMIIRVSGKNEKKVSDSAESLHSYIKRSLEETGSRNVILFPVSEPPLSKIKNRFKKNISLITPKTSTDLKKLNKIIANIPDLKGVSITFDVDPLNEA